MSDYIGSSSSDPAADPPDPRPQPIAGAASQAPVSPRSGLISSASAPVAGRVFEVWADSTEDAAEDDRTQGSSPVPDVARETPAIELTAVECRVLGAMIEKSYLTPDIYPMTTNAMVTACNQKTNRDPVVDFSAVLIDTTLMEMRERNLVRRVHSPGFRSMKHRQTLDEALALNDQQLALMSVLLLRGPQTIGELRLRTERHDVGFEDLDAVDACLASLANRSTPLVHQLPRQPGHKENRWLHLLSDAVATEHALTVDQDTSFAQATQPGALGSAADKSGLTDRLEDLETQVATLQRQLASLAEKLGEPLE